VLGNSETVFELFEPCCIWSAVLFLCSSRYILDVGNFLYKKATSAGFSPKLSYSQFQKDFAMSSFETVSTVFLRQLCVIPGMSVEKAVAIVQHWSTGKLLVSENLCSFSMLTQLFCIKYQICVFVNYQCLCL